MYRKTNILKNITAAAAAFLLFISSLSAPAHAQARTHAAINVYTAVNTAENGKEVGDPSEPASPDELDLIFSDLKAFYPDLALNPTGAGTAHNWDEVISAQTKDFADTLFEESVRALNGLALSIDHFNKIAPDEGRVLNGICEQFISDLSDFRTEAYLEGKKDRNSSSPLSAEAMEAIYEKNTLLEEAVTAVKVMKEGRTAGTAYLNAAASYLSFLARYDLSYLDFYHLGRYGALTPEPMTGTALETIRVYAGPSSDTEPIRKIKSGDSVTLVDTERNRYGNYWGLLSGEGGFIWLGNKLNFSRTLADSVCAFAMNEYNSASVKYLTNNNKYNRFFGDSGSSWCAYFIVYSAVQAGVPDSVIPGSNRTRDGVYTCVGGCASLRNYMLKYCNAVWHPYDSSYQPEPGDIVYYGSGKSITSIKHVGLITGSDENYLDSLSSGKGTYILTVEGNTSDETHKNGGCINVKQRNLEHDGKTGTFYVLGYLTPDYPAVTE